MSDEIKVISYKKTYPKLTNKLFNDNPLGYNFLVQLVKEVEFKEHGMMVSKVYKPTSKGTCLLIKDIESEQDFTDYYKKIKEEGSSLLEHIRANVDGDPLEFLALLKEA